MDSNHNRASTKFAIRILMLLSAITVFSGGMIYILFRPSEPIFFDWVNAIGFESWLSEIRDRTLSIGHIFPHWFIYSLPSGLWAFGYTAIVGSIWTGSKSVLKFFWFGSIPALVFGFELLQQTGEIPGTFSMSDIIWSAIGITTGFITVYLTIQRSFLFKRKYHLRKSNSQLYLESN
jgi:hypothetical protein